MKVKKPNRAKLSLELELEQDCPKEVLMWNYYDHEHLLGTHGKLYHEARVLAERDNWSLVYRRAKIPIVPFQNEGIGFQYLENNVMRTIHKDTVGFMLDMEVHFFDLDNERSKAKIIYSLEVPKWMKFIEPLFKVVFTSWLKHAWAEDVPMRNRRWKVYKLGFKDFCGIDWINKKSSKPVDYKYPPYEFNPPVPSLPQIRNEGVFRVDSSRIEIPSSDYKVEVNNL